LSQSIVEEASANGRKVVVFSYFREVLEIVAAHLGDIAMGPLTGSIPPIHRQSMIDDFTVRRGPAVCPFRECRGLVTPRRVVVNTTYLRVRVHHGRGRTAITAGQAT
jgi:hypothetical protein